MKHFTLNRLALLGILFLAFVQQAFATGHTVTISGTNVTCNGGSNGTATASVSGGVGPFMYSWAPSGGSAATATGLTTGVYTCTVTDQNDMSTATQTVNITQPTAVNGAISSTNATCFNSCNGTATVIASGGTPPYTYNWTPGGGNTSTITNRCAGTYTVTITDSNGCIATRTTTITQPTPMSLTPSSVNNVTCNGNCNGSVTMLASGGTGPYVYSWAPGGGTAPSAIMLCAGSYTATVTDANGCSISNSISITQPGALNVSLSGLMNPTCGFNNGMATAVPSGGTAPYSYLWQPSGMTTQNVFNLFPGTHTVTVTDANGCTGTATFNMVPLPVPTISSFAVSPNDTVCAGQSFTITPTVTGMSPFTYNWTPSGSTSGTLTGSVSTTTTYTLTVTDMNGCVASNGTTVYVGNTLQANISVVDANCNQSNGSATANVTSGNPPYTYLWSDNSTGSAITNMPAGAYNVTINDAVGCSQNFPAGISNIAGPAVTVTTQNAGCTNASNGTATATVTGTSPFTYQWSTQPSQSTATASGLVPGLYQVTVTDAAGCVTVDQGTVGATAGNLFLWVYATAISTCNTPTGGATTMVSGGTAPYSYLWSNSATTPSVSGLTASSYSVTVTDANGCPATGSLTIPNSCVNRVRGQMYIDVNTNCVFDSGDIPYSGVLVSGAPGNYLANTDNMGNYEMIIGQPGTFTISPTNSSPYWTVGCPGSGNYAHTFATVGDTLASADFALAPTANAQDLWVSLYSGIARPGFALGYTLSYGNAGLTIVSDTVFFRHDSILSFTTSYPAPSGYTYPNAYWLFNNLLPNQSRTIYITMQVPTIGNGGYLGRHLISNARIEPIALDYTPLNNGDDDNRVIQGSYDPNLKECWAPMMDEQTGDIDLINDTTLTYGIHFQNSGTDTAFTVVVRDTLPQELDATTFRAGPSSHPYTWTLSGGQGVNVLTFTFNNILLPDSNTNEPASHGFVSFEINRMPGLPVGTVIQNRASNYFDFNPGVLTNSTSNMIVNPLAVLENKTATGVRAVPNPFTESTTLLFDASDKFEVQLFDIAGRQVYSSGTQNGNSFVLGRGTLEAGVYLCRVQTETNGLQVLRVVVK